MVHIDDYDSDRPNVPFGGVQDSGYGREHDGFDIEEFVNMQSIMSAVS